MQTTLENIDFVHQPPWLAIGTSTAITMEVILIIISKNKVDTDKRLIAPVSIVRCAECRSISFI